MPRENFLPPGSWRFRASVVRGHWKTTTFVGALRFMDMNAFSKLTELLRKPAKRTIDVLRDRIFALLGDFAPNECANYFAAAGCRPDQIESALIAPGDPARFAAVMAVSRGHISVTKLIRLSLFSLTARKPEYYSIYRLTH